jgi:hypothetical protein
MKKPLRVPDGALRFRQYLAANSETPNIPAFCEKHGHDRIQLQRVVFGERAASAELAAQIERETCGDVPASSWGTFDLGLSREDVAAKRGKAKNDSAPANDRTKGAA